MSEDVKHDPFRPLLDAIQHTAHENQVAGMYAFQEQTLDAVPPLVDQAQRLADFQAKVAELQHEWHELATPMVQTPTIPRRLVPKFTWRDGVSGLQQLVAQVNLPLVWTLLCLIAGQLLFVFNQDPNAAPEIRNHLGVGLHLLAVGLGMLSFRRDTLFNRNAVAREGWLLGLLLVLAILTRVLWLNTVPYILDGDASAFANGALPFINNQPNTTIFSTGWQGHTNGYFWLLSQVLKMFGLTISGIRAFSVIGGVLGVLAIYWMGRSLVTPRTGLLAGFVAAVLPFDLVFSRVGTEVIHLTWLAPVVITSLWHGWQRKRGWLLMVAGAVAGVSQYFYPGARLIPILAVLQIGCLVLFPTGERREWRWSLKATGWLMIGFVVIYGPMIAYFLQHTTEYMARITTVSISSSGWLERESVNRSLVEILSEQARRAYGVWLFPMPGARLWFLEPQYLSPMNAALLACGLIGLAFSRTLAMWLRVFLGLYLLVGMFLAGVMTIDTPMPSRYVIFVPVIALLIAWSLNKLVAQFDGTLSQWQRRVLAGMLVLTIASYSTANLRSYARHDTQTTWSNAFSGQISTVIIRYLLSLPNQEYTVLYLAEGVNYFEANPSLPVLSHKQGVNINPNTDCVTLSQSLRAGQNVIIAPPARVAELYPISQRIVGAEVLTLRNPKNQDLATVMRFYLPADNIQNLVCGVGTP